MSSLLYALGTTAHRRWRAFLGIWLLVLILAGVAAGTLGQGTSENFSIPGTESQEALDRLGQTFPQASGVSAQLVAVAEEGSVTDPAVRDTIAAAVVDLQALDQVAAVVDPLAEPGSASVSADGSAAILTVQLATGAEGVTVETLDGLLDIADEASTESVSFTAGGGAFGSPPPGVTITEGVGVLVALVVLALTFGSLLAAGMPLITALVGIGVAMALLVASTAVIDLSSTAPLLALMIGLAVGIDYALFILARHRAQLAAGLDPQESTGRAVATAGSAVVFAGLTVMIALGGLFVAGIPFLTVMGLAAAAAVAVAVLVALTLLPAILGALGPRLRPRTPEQRRVRLRRRPRQEDGRSKEGKGLATRWVRLVTAAPLATVLIVVVGLGAMALPARDLALALPDNGTVEEGTPQRETYDLLSERFGPGFNGPLIVTGDIVQSTDPLGLVGAIADEIRSVEGVAAVPLATPNPDADTMLIQVVPTSGPASPETTELVERIRALAPVIAAEHDVDIAVTGQTAVGVDISDKLLSALLPFGVLVVGLALVLLAMVFRSVLVPLKATAGYLLSVGASFGAVVAVYQWGWFEGSLHTVATGPVISFMPILLMGVLFGLAMDYEVFLVSRMREDYVHSGDARASVRTGFVASSRVVAAAAVIMIAVFAAFVPEGDFTLQPIAFGLAVGVFIDAFLVRMTLVPAVMALLGERAWWLPARLDRALPSFDVEGEGLARQLDLADWPSPDAPPGVYAESLTLTGPDVVSFQDVDLAVGPGTVLPVDGGSPAARTALLLTLAGRTTPTSGRLKVAGLVLPEQSLLVRRRVALVRAVEEDGADGLLDALRRALRRSTSVVLVDGLERLSPADAGRVVVAVERLCQERDLAGLVTGASARPGPLLDITTGGRPDAVLSLEESR